MLVITFHQRHRQTDGQLTMTIPRYATLRAVIMRVYIIKSLKLLFCFKFTCQRSANFAYDSLELLSHQTLSHQVLAYGSQKILNAKCTASAKSNHN